MSLFHLLYIQKNNIGVSFSLSINESHCICCIRGGVWDYTIWIESSRLWYNIHVKQVQCVHRHVLTELLTIYEPGASIFLYFHWQLTFTVVLYTGCLPNESINYYECIVKIPYFKTHIFTLTYSLKNIYILQTQMMYLWRN